MTDNLKAPEPVKPKPRLMLGKLAPKPHLKTLVLAKYLTPLLPPPPEKVYREYKIPLDAWGMFGNDKIGNCTFACIAHLLMLVTAHTGRLVIPEEADVIKGYSAVTGYDPKTGLNDNGAAITDVLNYWQTEGLAGHKILGWAKIDHTSPLAHHQGIYIFGGNDIGVELPNVAQEQFNDGKNWEVVPNDGGIDGGHCILESGYGADGSNYCSWGKGDQKASNAWSDKYCDEGYVVITKDWINEASGLAPNLLNLDALIADLKAMAR